MMIAIVDYGMGNLRSVQKAVERVGTMAKLTRDGAEIADADGIILPGVGAYGLCMENLNKFKLVEPIKKFISSGKPFLGICLGLQLLYERSEEFGPVDGLGILKGSVVRFPSKPDLKIPHLGWNNIKVVKTSPLLEGVPDNSYVYFVHSYFVAPEKKSDAMTTTTHGVEFVSAVHIGNIYATQFHPEKSQKIGLRILTNFCNIVNKKVRE